MCIRDRCVCVCVYVCARARVCVFVCVCLCVTLKQSSSNNFLCPRTVRSDDTSTTAVTTPAAETISDSADDDIPLWSAAWKVWINIATLATKPPDKSETAAGEKVYVPSQNFLTALMHTFPALFDHIKARSVGLSACQPVCVPVCLSLSDRPPAYLSFSC